MSREAASRFWTERDEYHELAETFERNVKISAPSGHFECNLNGLTAHCPFCASTVNRYEYTGPSI